MLDIGHIPEFAICKDAHTESFFYQLVKLLPVCEILRKQSPVEENAAKTLDFRYAAFNIEARREDLSTPLPYGFGPIKIRQSHAAASRGQD